MANQVTTLRMNQKFKRTPAGDIPIDWTVCPLEELADILIGGTPSRSRPEFWDSELQTENHWVSIADMKGRFIHSTKERLTTLGIEKSNVKRIPVGTVLMSFKLTIGRMAIAATELFTNEAIAAFIPKNGLDKDFLYYALPILAAAQEADVAVKGRTLNKGKLLRMPFITPPVEEQVRIAEILSGMDAWLDGSRAVLDGLRNLKEGILQKFFGAGTRSQASSQGWKVLPLQDVATLQRGVDLPVQSRREGNVPVYGSNGILGNHDETEFNGPGVVTGRSGTIGQVFFSEGPYWPLNTTLHVVNFHDNNPRFIALLLESMKLEQFAAYTGVPSLNRNFVHPLLVSVPPLGDQAHLVEVIANCNRQIVLEEKNFGFAEAVKNGVARMLLTGKVRV